MDRISDKRKSMAALAVFRDLYNQKKDIYSVISEFAKLAIVENRLKTFELQQIINIIKMNNGIDIPIAVVKRSLSRLKFLDREGTMYIVNPEVAFDADQIAKETQKEEKENQRIIKLLNSFYETKTGRKLTDEERCALCNEFCTFIIDDTNAPIYGEYISEFIIKNSLDKEFLDQLDQIRQGVVIFIAFNYNTDFNSIDKIDIPLNIYLDTEILFHMYGLNGCLYKKLFDEFYDLVAEINKRARKKLVRLFYFSESEEEINTYFYVAERIVRKEERLDPSRQAMRNIVNGCSDPYEVVDKKTKFYKTLEEKDITLDTQGKYYDKEANYQFLIKSDKFYEEKTDDVSDKDIDRKVNLLNYISIKRGFKSQKIFRNIGHILLSANKITFNIAYDKSIWESNSVPLATSLSFLTNRFWLALNKGLTNIASLQSISIITKAQIALSTKINDNVGKLYAQYVEQDKKGKYDAEQSKACLAELHKSVVNPDDLTTEKTDNYVEILTVNDINSYIAEKALYEVAIQEEVSELKQSIETERKKYHMVDKKHKAAIDKAAKEILRNRNKIYQQEYESAISDYNQAMTNSVSTNYINQRKQYVKITVLYIGAIVLLYLLSIIVIKKYVVLSFIVGLVLFALPFILPFMPHNKIVPAIKFCFCKKNREKLRNSLVKEYKDNNPEPILKQCSLDDIIKELESEEKEIGTISH